MFREMRRKRQKLSKEECEEILFRGTSGVLAVSGDDGYPYAVPLSYLYENGKLFFHCAKAGHKLDSILRNEKASFCVIAQDQIVPEEYTTYFRSVIVFGRIRVMEEDDARRTAIEKLALKYAPGESAESREQAIERGVQASVHAGTLSRAYQRKRSHRACEAEGRWRRIGQWKINCISGSSSSIPPSMCWG